MKKRFLVLTAVIISSQLHAQDTSKTKELDELIVTATKFEQKQSTTGKVVIVIDQQTLQRNVGKTITEIINYQAGIFINGANNNLGTNQDIYFRGASTGNTLILIDGVPVGDPSQINNSFDLNNIAIGQVERIEILKGAQSTLWGSDAVAGVINIITKKGNKDKITPTALLSYGSYNTLRGNAGIGGAIKKLNYNVGYNFTNSNGFSSAYDSTGVKNFENDKFAQNNIQSNLHYQISNHFALKSLLSFAKYKADIDAGAFQDDKDNVIDNKNTIINQELTYTVDKIKLNLSQTFINAERIFTDDSASSAYKIPSLYQLYSEYGNKSLKPEKSNNYEIGFQTFTRNHNNSFRLTGFKRDARDLIIFFTDPVTYDGKYINRDLQQDYGIEMESTIAIGAIGNWSNNFTYVDGEGTENKVKVKNLFRRPNITLNSVLTLQPTKLLTISTSYRYIGTRLKGEYDAGPSKMPQYYTLDCYLGYKYSKRFNVFIDLRNITNQQYFDVVGYNSKKFNVMTGISINL